MSSLNGSQPSNGHACHDSDYKIHLDQLSRRLKALHEHWNEYRDGLWGSSNVLAIATPPPSNYLRYSKSSAMNIWLFGCEFLETVMIIGEKQIHFLCCQLIGSLLEAEKETVQDAICHDIVVHVKSKDEDGTTQMDAIFNSIRTQLKSPVVGYIAKEAPEGKLLEMWADKLTNSGLQLGDITHGISDILAIKDPMEIQNARKAAYLTASRMKYCVVPKLEKVIYEGKKATHSSLSEETMMAVLKESENVDVCYAPIFQSGGKFDLRPSAISDDETLYYDSGSIIICALGSRYNSYCSNVARTYLIDPTSAQMKAYEVLLKAQEAAITALKAGNKINAVYQAANAVVERDAPELASKLTKSAGWGMGLEFRESGLRLNAENDKVLKQGMVFNVSLGFQNLQAETINPKSRNFSLILADTVIVTSEICEVATHLISKALKDVAYSFNPDGGEEKQIINALNVIKEALLSKRMLRTHNQWEELKRGASYVYMVKCDESDSEDERWRKKSFGKLRGLGLPSFAGPSKRLKFR
ncbi:unnamed protein product [Cuscuta campestris]|uniref:FACT complex subunit n=1 Tax=Cuscuta campestris TaxID=132261 RepID=A0A484LR58_9ASTE|nr:unnamed protein product [Cuscuta campestris]